MHDQEFLFQFEQCTLPKEYFRHKSHIRIAWLYLSKFPIDDAIPLITQGIIRYATSLGAAHIYHETLTRAWIYLVAASMKGIDSDFEAFIDKNPHLLDKNLPFNYYSLALLQSEQAKQQWIEPDIKPL
ncbi:MAG TPA: hypothetical protein VHA13_02530 [Gammaproteobacteria bacterium]|nr:hypothetical protein [Gammaproteobacteria bacterium]